MNVKPLMQQAAAQAALLAYKQHRAAYDKHDWEIERIYRAIARGKIVVSALQAIPAAGLNEQGWPKLAIMRADQEVCICSRSNPEKVTMRAPDRFCAKDRFFEIAWTNRPQPTERWRDASAVLPRIPPQHRPETRNLSKYHVLWEANWTSIPRDPMLLKRIGRDAWIVLAAWELTEVELSVLQAYQVR